ncbi:MAG: ATP-binding cassette, subfamily bacterial [Thermoleophilaceae bacterium]|jgi:ATP-binding cassette subfamily B protein|nr:ATP-binding cassette, subfamily bacterial [Thermoleophilaceae bacterium]
MNTFWRLLSFLRPYRRGVIVSFVLAAVAMGTGVLIPFLVGRTIDEIRKGETNLWPLAFAILGAGLVRLVFSVVRRLIAGRVSLGVEYDLRNRMYKHLQSLELAFFDEQQTGQLMSRSTVDLQAVRFFLGYGLIFILQSLVTIVVAAAVMLALNVQLGLLALAPAPLIFVVALRYGRRNRPASQEVQQRIAELTAEVEENVGGIRLVKAFAREERQLGRVRDRAARVFDQSMVSTRLRAFYNPFIGFLPNLGLIVVLIVGGRQAIRGQITIGEFVAFYGYVQVLVGPVRMLGIALGMAQRAVASGARVFEVLDRQPEMTVPANAPPLPAGDGHVELRDVSFTYVGAEEPVLHGVRLDVPAGRTIALVGGTGSGKSTLVSLLPRLYDPSAGSVRIDGADVSEVRLESLRSQVGLVSDDPFLFSDTIRNNIAYARADAPQDVIEDAARRADIHDFIVSMPDGYDTLVGERGVTLSGGQRQRVAIARALVMDPRVLILDDATSSVDATTEAAIKRALRELMEGRTTFIIGHRLSTIALADEIVVLEGGAIAARGSHDELVETSELYREIAEKGAPDRRFLTRDTREPEAAGL